MTRLKIVHSFVACALNSICRYTLNCFICSLVSNGTKILYLSFWNNAGSWAMIAAMSYKLSFTALIYSSSCDSSCDPRELLAYFTSCLTFSTRLWVRQSCTRRSYRQLRESSDWKLSQSHLSPWKSRIRILLASVISRPWSHTPLSLQSYRRTGARIPLSMLQLDLPRRFFYAIVSDIGWQLTFH